jgi:NAD(P)-dependent dehydrogenase (short-subunit alcohol dehydrogenase family)
LTPRAEYDKVFLVIFAVGQGRIAMPVAVITGASIGLGRALARELAAAGWDLVVDARGTDRLADARGELDSLGSGRIIALPGDVTDPAHRDALIEAAASLGGVDVLVNNASTLGPTPMPRLAEYGIADLEAVYRTNVIAPLALVQRALTSLQARAGTVVSITSDAAVEGYEGWGGYGSSKGALEQLTNVLAAEHPELRVYWFDPGDMRTEMHQDAFPGEDISDRPAPETVVPALRRLLDDRPPSGRYRSADLLAAAT